MSIDTKCRSNTTKPYCFLSPRVYLFREEETARDKCEERFGLKDKYIFYLGCFNGAYQRKAAEPDRLVLQGNPPLAVSSAIVVPASSRSAFVVNRVWELGSVTIYELDDKLRPSFSLNVFERYLPNLVEKRIGVPTNQQLVRCGDY